MVDPQPLTNCTCLATSASGTSGTNGCLMNFGGTGLIETCASRRYKKGITPFGPALGRVAALQPVHFCWRADEFADHHFGDSRAYGLIAQDVEQVLLSSSSRTTTGTRRLVTRSCRC